MDKIKLKVAGLSYSQTQTGAYALVLEAENSDHRIPIIIGSFEAQAIALQLENLTPPRPLTHDLFVSVAEKLDVNLKEVNIYKLEEGVFYSQLVLLNKGRLIKIDARTSDAVALALRFKCPIYTTRDIIDKAGLIINIEDEAPEGQATDQETETSGPEKKDKQTPSTDNLSEKSLQELNDMLRTAIEKEAYEEASRISDEIKRRKSNKKD
ncbi:MAG: bifunctional nuclease domain-containing protein [Bacteroidales bacterium]